MSKYINRNFIILQVLLVLMVFCGGAEAKSIETGLWGIDWDADENQVKQSLEGQGFVLLDQGREATDRQWQKFGNGMFSDIQCDVKVAWQAKKLAEVTIESTGNILLGTNGAYQSLVARFTNEYGQSQEKDRYMLKSFPGVWIEWTKWRVADKELPTFEVTLIQNSLADATKWNEATSGKISISFTKSVSHIH